MIPVTLTPLEMEIAGIVGVARNIDSQGAGYRNHYQVQTYDKSIEGAAGELAFAKGTGLWWTALPLRHFRGPDVGTFEVRTRTADMHDLCVRREDPDDRKVALVLGTMPTFQIIGWITARDGKRPEWWHERYGVYWVPISALNTLNPRPKPGEVTNMVAVR